MNPASHSNQTNSSTMTAKDKYPWAFQKDEKVEHLPCLTMQELVNPAEFFLCLHSAILYGFIEGELPDAEKCEHYIELGKHYGVMPVKGYVPNREFLIEMGFNQTTSS